MTVGGSLLSFSFFLLASSCYLPLLRRHAGGCGTELRLGPSGSAPGGFRSEVVGFSLESLRGGGSCGSSESAFGVHISDLYFVFVDLEV